LEYNKKWKYLNNLWDESLQKIKELCKSSEKGNWKDIE
jgi:hypothetical protein